MPKRADLSDTFCPVGRSAEILGDRAVLLILRDLFFGRRRFEAITASTRLVVARRPYQDRPPRHEYRLTDKGKDLFGVLYAMRGWAERWAYRKGETGGGPAMRYIHRTCGADVGTATVCPGCGAELGYGDLKGEASPALSAEQAARTS
jgi:DNA-binding HxlR family transcriptional regulator